MAIKSSIKGIFLIIFLFSSYICPAAEEKQIIVVFRYDDYRNYNRTNIDLMVINEFRKRNIPCTFGVVPFSRNWDSHDPEAIKPLSAMKINILKDAIKRGFLEVALHGYTHKTIANTEPKKETEFRGLDYESQLTSISKGKKCLEEMLDIKITTFIPPWNTYDSNTVRALEYLGFETISAGKGGVREKNSSLKYLPSTHGLSHLQEAVKSARSVPDNKPVIVVDFHEFSFVEVNKKKGEISYQDFTKLLDWVASQKDVSVRSINQATMPIPLRIHESIRTKH